jgi:hypothetical protein
VETEFLVVSLSSSFGGLVKIDNLPSLINSSTFSTISILHSNSLSFFIFASSNIKNLVVRWIEEVFILEEENLEPSGVSAPDLHVVGSTSTLDIPGLVVISCSDSLRLLVEVPDLCFSTVSGLDNEVSVVDQIKISV